MRAKVNIVLALITSANAILAKLKLDPYLNFIYVWFR